MFNNSGGYSLADIAAATGGGRNGGGEGYGDGWGGGAWWIIVLFLFVFCGWGNNGWGNGRNGGGADTPAFQGAVTRADLCSEFAFNNLDRAVTGINQGLCDGFYAMNSSLMSGFNGVDNAICSLGNAMQGGFNATQVAMMQGNNALQAQLADCCYSCMAA